MERKRISTYSEKTTKKILNGEKTKVHNPTLRNSLIRHGHKEHKCEVCGRKTYNYKKIPIELHHDDGNRKNNRLKNLKIVCPNCHSRATKKQRGKR